MQLLNRPGLAIGFLACSLLLGNIHFFTVLFLHHSHATPRPLLCKRERVQFLPLLVNTHSLAHGGIQSSPNTSLALPGASELRSAPKTPRGRLCTAK